MIQILEQVVDDSGFIIKNDNEYEKTMIGAFHTAVHFDDMKQHIVSN